MMTPEQFARAVLMLQYGVGAFCVLFTIFILFHVFKFVWEVKTKETKTEKENLAHQMAELEEALRSTKTTLEKYQKDLNRYYTGLKILAGNRWITDVKPFLDDEKS